MPSEKDSLCLEDVPGLLDKSIAGDGALIVNHYIDQEPVCLKEHLTTSDGTRAGGRQAEIVFWITVEQQLLFIPETTLKGRVLDKRLW